MGDLNKELEEDLINLLFWQARLLDELIALAFVDVGDYIVINTIVEDGCAKQVVSLHPNIDQMDVRGIEILQGENGLTVRAPYQMEALNILWRFLGEGVNDHQESMTVKIEKERKNRKDFKRNSATKKQCDIVTMEQKDNATK